jgi:hypothetical protein
MLLKCKFHFFVFLAGLLISQPNLGNDTIPLTEKTKSGWTFGAVPVIAYDSDIGFKYGGLVNFYDYGDGTIYPEYKHSVYIEWSRTTKGSGINQITYDSKYLIPRVRVSGELSYLTEKSLDFYGYNGYKALYDETYEDDSPENPDYISRVFYRQERKLIRARADFSGRVKNSKFNWVLGAVFYDIKLDTVDITRLNKGQPEEKKLPAVGGGLYGAYNVWNALPQNQYYGGQSTLFKAGIIFDTRDNEPMPMHGVWTEFILYLDPGLIGGNSYRYGKFNFTHRQYLTLLQKKLVFAYRLSYQGRLYGQTPIYMLPFVLSSGRYTDRDALGGSKTLRGILRNRVVGEDFTYGNFELRWKFYTTTLFKQNLYLALSTFTDMGMVTREYPVYTEEVTQPQFFPDVPESLHQSIGAGLRVALNENFIIAVDYGMALDERDGDRGLYINLNWLF